jgi:hypothetical protein
MKLWVLGFGFCGFSILSDVRCNDVYKDIFLVFFSGCYLSTPRTWTLDFLIDYRFLMSHLIALTLGAGYGWWEIMIISKLAFMRVRGASERLVVIISDPQKEKDDAMLAARRRGESTDEDEEEDVPQGMDALYQFDDVFRGREERLLPLTPQVVTIV